MRPTCLALRRRPKLMRSFAVDRVAIGETRIGTCPEILGAWRGSGGPFRVPVVGRKRATNNRDPLVFRSLPARSGAVRTG